MGYTLILELPEEIYAPLRKTAEQTKQKPEELAVRWLASAAQQQLEDDPLEKFIGAFRSDVLGWPEQHDYHTGQALVKEVHH